MFDLVGMVFLSHTLTRLNPWTWGWMWARELQWNCEHCKFSYGKVSLFNSLDEIKGKAGAGLTREVRVCRMKQQQQKEQKTEERSWETAMVLCGRKRRKTFQIQKRSKTGRKIYRFQMKWISASGDGLLFEWCNCSKIRMWWWLHNSVNRLKTPNLCTSRAWILCYVNYISIKLLFKTIWGRNTLPQLNHLKNNVIALTVRHKLSFNQLCNLEHVVYLCKSQLFYLLNGDDDTYPIKSLRWSNELVHINLLEDC